MQTKVLIPTWTALFLQAESLDQAELCRRLTHLISDVNGDGFCPLSVAEELDSRAKSGTEIEKRRLGGGGFLEDSSELSKI
jgi:hypothetical protein